MAITEITPSAVSLDTGFVLTTGAGTAINTSNTMEFAYPKQGHLLITIDSNHASTSASFTAGYGVAAGLGSLACAVGDTVMQGFVFSSDRLLVATGAGASACLLYTSPSPRDRS